MTLQQVRHRVTTLLEKAKEGKLTFIMHLVLLGAVSTLSSSHLHSPMRDSGGESKVGRAG